MKRLKSRVIIGIIAVAFILVANLQYAFSEYGILFANSLHINVLAQTSNGSSSKGSSSTSSNSNTGTSSNDKNSCPDYNYVPDKYIVAVEGFITIKYSSEGKIQLDKLGGSYQKDKEYTMATETKNCNGDKVGACCDQRQVGVKIVK